MIDKVRRLRELQKDCQDRTSQVSKYRGELQQLNDSLKEFDVDDVDELEKQIIQDQKDLEAVEQELNDIYTNAMELVD